MFRALKYPNYRLFFFGQGISLIGTWLTTTATSWLVFRLASQQNFVIKAAMVLGIVRFAGQIPMFLLAPAAGVLVDRWNRHRILIVAQILSMLQSAALAYLALSGKIRISHVIVLNFIQGAVNSFDASARQAFVAEIIQQRSDLPNAIALNSSLFNGARLLGPAIAGLLIWKVGEGMCFLIDAISYMAVVVALLMMTVAPRVKIHHQNSPLRQLKDGFKYAFGFRPVRGVLMLSALISLTVSAYQTLMPIFAERLTTHENASRVFGFLGAAVGVGALSGAIHLASRRSVLGLGRVIAVSSMLVGLSMTAFALTSQLWLAMLLAIVGGYGMINTFAASNTVLQTVVEDEMRGRLMSFFIMAIMGTAPIGSLIAGYLADRFNVTRTIVGCGVISVAGALLFLINLPAIRAQIRPIYVRKGIIPEVATGLTAANLVEEE